MRIGFLVNDRRDLGARQTTTLLIRAALRRRHQVVVCGVGDLTLTGDGQLLAAGCEPTRTEPDALTSELATPESSSHGLDALDLCVVRTNPGRDESHRAEHVAALRLLEGMEERGVAVVNSPRGLSRALTKLSLLDLPESLRPRTLVTRDASAIERFVADAPSRAVIKPLEGTRGRDVFVLERARSSANMKQIIEVVLRQGYAVVQEFVPGAEKGDVRVTVVDGEVLELGGKAAAVARVPSRDDFRSNLHAGGSAASTSVTSEMRDAIEEIAPVLKREGLRHVGLDFVGGQILELNVFSPGGLFPSEQLYQQDFSSAVVEAFERRV